MPKQSFVLFYGFPEIISIGMYTFYFKWLYAVCKPKWCSFENKISFTAVTAKSIYFLFMSYYVLLS